jgi:hypothetical protein
MANQLMPAGSSSVPLANDASVSDEISRAGIGLGALVERTGDAIAATQEQLNETGARTATALANTLVDLIAVEERIYHDDGTLDHVETHTRQLPLINFIDPVFYQWTNVRLQGRYMAREFSASTESEVTTASSRSGSGQAGLLVILGGGYNNFQYSHSKSNRNTQVDNDLSVGQMRMNTLLEPREDVGVPKPNQAIQGPRLSLIQGEIVDVIDSGVINARTMSMMIQYNRRDGTAISGKAISIETNGVAWSYMGDSTTDASGQLEIQLRREFIGEDADRTPVDIIVSARIGLVQNTTTVTF